MKTYSTKRTAVRTLFLVGVLALFTTPLSYGEPVEDRSVSIDGGDRSRQDSWILAGALQEERRRVESDLAGEESQPRENLLVMYGRSAGASGRFELAAAAYLMFLHEFGTDHPYSERIALRLADCLAPLSLDSIDVLHTAAGPQYGPTWRMGRAASTQRLRQAVAAYDLAASITHDPQTKGAALLRLGWVHRALDDWTASTAAWDRCATAAAVTGKAADALWLAAENLEWTDRPLAAAERLRRIVAEYPDERRVSQCAKWIESLEAESRREARWLADPVAGLKSEIEERSGMLGPHDVYQSVSAWLRRRGDTRRLIEVGRWAVRQSDWPTMARLRAQNDLIDALLSGPDVDEAAKLEAAEVYEDVIDIAPDDGWLVGSSIRRFRLLSGLGRFDAADAALDRVQHRIDGSLDWEPRVLNERIRSLLSRGDHQRAKEVFEELARSYPEHGLTQEWHRSLNSEESK